MHDIYFLNVLCFDFNPVLLGIYLLSTYLHLFSFTYSDPMISASGDRNRPFFESVEPH